jgi:hypothetical protein
MSKNYPLRIKTGHLLLINTLQFAKEEPLLLIRTGIKYRWELSRKWELGVNPPPAPPRRGVLILHFLKNIFPLGIPLLGGARGG